MGSWRRFEKKIEEKSDGCQMNTMFPVFQPMIHLVSMYRSMSKQQVEALDLKAMKKQVVDTWEQVRENGRVIKYSWTCKYVSLKDALKPVNDMIESILYDVYPNAPKPWQKDNKPLVKAFIELWQRVKPIARERLMIECHMDATNANKILSPLSTYPDQWQHDLKTWGGIPVNADSLLVNGWETFVFSVNQNRAADVFNKIKVPEECIAVLSAVLEPVRDFVNRVFHAQWDHRPLWERPFGEKTDVDRLIVPPSNPPKLQRSSAHPIKHPRVSPSSPPKLQRRSSPSIKVSISSPPKLHTPPKLRPGECPYGKVVNPLTKKCIDANGKLARMLRVLKVIK